MKTILPTTQYSNENSHECARVKEFLVHQAMLFLKRGHVFHLKMSIILYENIIVTKESTIIAMQNSSVVQL